MQEIWQEFSGRKRRKAQQFWERFRIIFREKFRSSNKYFMQTSFCRRATLIAFGAHQQGCDNDTFRAVFPSIWKTCNMTNRPCLGNRFLSSAGVGKSCVLPIWVPNPSPTLDKILAIHGSKNFIQYWGWGLEDSSGISRLQHIGTV